jgi:hypothetical protein
MLNGKFVKHSKFRGEGSLIYMENIESIGFTPKNLKKKILLKSCFLPIKSHKT